MNTGIEKSKTAINLLGLPGSGKSTQARLLSLAFGFTYVSPGDIFRESLTNTNDQTRNAVAFFMEKGDLIPDEFFIPLVNTPLRQASDTSTGLILDGLPRSLNQAKWLEVSLKELGITICKVVYLDVSLEVVKQRVSERLVCRQCHAPGGYIRNRTKCDFCGSELEQRRDDRISIIDERLEEYHRETEPLIHLNESRGKLVHINGEQKIHTILAQLVNQIIST